MDNSDKWPLWVRIYADPENKSIIRQYAGLIFGLFVLVLVEFLLNEKDFKFFTFEQISTYIIIFLVASIHILLGTKSNSWVQKYSSFNNGSSKILHKGISYLLALTLLIIFVLVKLFLLK
jgi:hypothetical protein